MADWYLWLKAIHIIAVVSWMAGIFYLPRLLVYHCDVVPGSEASELFKVMERRLLAAIMRPAAAAVLISGALLFWSSSFSLLEVWLLVKLVAVTGLFAFHGLLETYVRQFAQDVRLHGGRFFRLINEIPTLLLVVIVVFVVVKPLQ